MTAKEQNDYFYVCALIECKRFIINRIVNLQLLWDTSNTWSNSLSIRFSALQKLYFNFKSQSAFLIAFVVPGYSKIWIGGIKSNEYNFKGWTLVRADHPVQSQWTYRSPVVYRKPDPCQHILLSYPGAAEESLWGSGSSGDCGAETGSCPNPALGNGTADFRSRCRRPAFDLSGYAGYPHWNSRTGWGGCDPEYSSCPAAALLGELSGVAKFFLVTGYTDMRKSIDGLMEIVRDTYELDPYSNSLFLFCGRRCDRIKALHFEKDGFCLYYKRLDNGRFQWPRDPSEVRNLTRQEYRWLLEGLSIDQPKAIRPAGKKEF